MTVHQVMITDMSGSMALLAADIRGGHNEYLNELTAMAVEKGEAIHITTTVFNTVVNVIDVSVPVAKATRFDRDTYSPYGMTALLDGVGETLQIFREKVKLAEGDKVFVHIQTDGLENSSKEYTRQGIAEKIQELEAENWAFVFSGTGITDWRDRDSVGLRSSTFNTGTSVGTLAAYRGRAKVVEDYFEADPIVRTKAFDSLTVSERIQGTIDAEGDAANS